MCWLRRMNILTLKAWTGIGQRIHLDCLLSGFTFATDLRWDFNSRNLNSNINSNLFIIAIIWSFSGSRIDPLGFFAVFRFLLSSFRLAEQRRLFLYIYLLLFILMLELFYALPFAHFLLIQTNKQFIFAAAVAVHTYFFLSRCFDLFFSTCLSICLLRC